MKLDREYFHHTLKFEPNLTTFYKKQSLQKYETSTKKRKCFLKWILIALLSRFFILKRHFNNFLMHFQELVRRGIPHHFRGMAWQLLCSAHESKDKAKYADYMKRQSACEKVIRRDIARTYPEHGEY